MFWHVLLQSINTINRVEPMNNTDCKGYLVNIRLNGYPKVKLC